MLSVYRLFVYESKSSAKNYWLNLYKFSQSLVGQVSPRGLVDALTLEETVMYGDDKITHIFRTVQNLPNDQYQYQMYLNKFTIVCLDFIKKHKNHIL